MKLKEFKEITSKLEYGQKILVNHRCRWNAPWGRKEVLFKEKIYTFNRIFHNSLDVKERKYDLSYRAIKSIKLVRK